MLVVMLGSGCTITRFLGIAMQDGNEPLTPRTVLDRDARCMLVLLPGMGDDPRRFEQHGFVDTQRDDPSGCDVTIVDSHFGYYRDANVVPRLTAVLTPLRAQYEQVWLVGVSLGGYGAAWTARERPDLVDGVVLISPFLGLPQAVEPLVAQVERDGLRSLRPGVLKASDKKPNPRRHFMEVEPLWLWLADRSHSEVGTEVHVAWGEGDKLAPTIRVIGDEFDERATSCDGAHDWDTFGRLFHRVAERAPWKS